MQPALSQERHIAEARTLAEIQAACRVRAEELNISRETIDEIAGFTKGYACKILAPVPIRTMGAMSMSSLLGALGLKLIVAEDAEALKKQAGKRSDRTRHGRRTYSPSMQGISQADIDKIVGRRMRKRMREIGREGGIKRRESLTPEQRSMIASNAVKARWKKRGPVRRRRRK